MGVGWPLRLPARWLDPPHIQRSVSSTSSIIHVVTLVLLWLYSFIAFSKRNKKRFAGEPKKMSFFGYDLLDGYSIANFVSDDEESFGAPPSLSSFAHTALQGDDDNVTRPPSVIEANDLDDEVGTLGMASEEDSVSGGITILSSASSSSPTSLVLMPRPSPPPSYVAAATTFAAPLDPHSGPLQHFSTDHALSISTTESVFTSAQNPAALLASAMTHSSRGSLLSLHPSSLSSSVVTDVSFPSERDSTLPSFCNDWLILNHSDAVPEHNYDNISNNNNQVLPDHPKSWYEALRTEEDWEALCDCAMQILTALGRQGSDTDMSPEEMLALLIQAEEQQFWKRQRGETSLWKWRQSLIDLALVATAAAAASVGARVAMQRHLL